MEVREKMKHYRESNGYSLDFMAKKCGMSVGLLSLVEDGSVTHPNYVEAIRKVYKLTKNEAEELLPVNRRPHHPEYEPDKYAPNLDPRTMSVLPRQDIVERYITEVYSKEIRQHQKRRDR